MRKLFKILLVVGVTILIVTPLTIFLVRGKKANDFYSNNKLQIQSNEVASLLVGDKLILAYTQADSLFAREQKLTGEIVGEYSLETENPINIQLFINNSQLFILWESVDNIYYSDFTNTTHFGIGEKPTIFKNTNELFLCFIRNDYLYCHRMNQQGSLWIIDYSVSDYTITTTETTSYIAYNKGGVIHYRICNYLLWQEAKSFVAGINAVFVPADTLELMYCYYYANNSLNIGYGVDSLTHTKIALEGDISYIQAYESDPSIVIFTKNGQMFLQEITAEGISDYYFVANGFEPVVHPYKDLLVIIYRDGFTYYSLVVSREDKQYFAFYDLKFDSLSEQTLDTNSDFSSWYDNYNSYYAFIWEEQEWIQSLGPVGEWAVEHPFWMTFLMIIFAFVIMLIIFFGLPYLGVILIKKRKVTKIGAGS